MSHKKKSKKPPPLPLILPTEDDNNGQLNIIPPNDHFIVPDDDTYKYDFLIFDTLCGVYCIHFRSFEYLYLNKVIFDEITSQLCLISDFLKLILESARCAGTV